MAFAKKTWKDRITEFPTRRTLTKSDGSTELVTVARAEGTVSQEGDAFNAASMNDLEERINQANNDLSERINSGLSELDIRYNAETGAPEWSPRGADTWSPFSSGKAKAELLWTNSNPSTGFPAQTVNFKENTYSHYIIFFYGRHNIHANPCTAFIGSNYTAPGGYFGVKGTGCYYVAGQCSVSRNITATTNASITFSQGYPSNDYIVPYAVYGVNINF